jgi:hypothetical protein
MSTVIPRMAAGGNMEVETSATGTNWVAFETQTCKQLTLVNDTGTAMEFRQDGAGVAIPVADDALFTIFGIENAAQIEVRRVDTSNTQVTLVARWEN